MLSKKEKIFIKWADKIMGELEMVKCYNCGKWCVKGKYSLIVAEDPKTTIKAPFCQNCYYQYIKE